MTAVYVCAVPVCVCVCVWGRGCGYGTGVGVGVGPLHVCVLATTFNECSLLLMKRV